MRRREWFYIKNIYVLLSYFGARRIACFPFDEGYMYIKQLTEMNYLQYMWMRPVSDIALGLTHLRRTKLQRRTFLRFGHPRLGKIYIKILVVDISVRLLATSTKICTIDSSTVRQRDRF